MEKEERLYRGIKWIKQGPHVEAWVSYALSPETRYPKQLWVRTVAAHVTFERVLARWGLRLVERALFSPYAVPADGVPWEINRIRNEKAYIAARDAWLAANAELDA